jgi:hypothetical protein
MFIVAINKYFKELFIHLTKHTHIYTHTHTHTHSAQDILQEDFTKPSNTI